MKNLIEWLWWRYVADNDERYALLTFRHERFKKEQGLGVYAPKADTTKE